MSETRTFKWSELLRDEHGDILVAKRFQPVHFTSIFGECRACKAQERVRRFRADIACGLHSGFPRCCIAFFVRFWRQRKVGKYGLRFWYHYMNGQARFLGVSPGYIMCPHCVFTRNIVQVKKCTCREGF